MVRYTGPKNRIARRFGVNIFGRLRNPLLHKANPPGVHGAKKKKKSDFGVQLEEKQKLRAIYGMLTHKQLHKYYTDAVRQEGVTAHVLLQRLETRLDSVVFRLGFASTIFHAQQLVAHGHVYVNGKRVDVRSFVVEPGMEISLSEKSKATPSVQQAGTQKREVPPYLSAEEGKFRGKLLSLPAFEQVPLPLPVNIPLICDFLAHNG